MTVTAPATIDTPVAVTAVSMVTKNTAITIGKNRAGVTVTAIGHVATTITTTAITTMTMIALDDRATTGRVFTFRGQG